MCGRFAIDDETNAIIEEIVEEHGIQALNNWRDYVPEFNISPTDQVPVIFQSKTGLAIRTARWAMLSPRAKHLDDRPGPTWNARKESAMISERTGRPSMWRTPLTKGQRCLVPASGYYEWVGAKAPKTPHWIYPESGLLMFAGLYSWWIDPALPESDESRLHLTTTIFTMDTVPELAAIHDRNPIALPEELWWQWIDPTIKGDQSLVDDVAIASQQVMAGLHEYVTAPVKGQAPAPITV